MRALVTVTEAVELLKISQQRLSVLLRQGRFPNAWKAGKTWIIPRADIDKYIAGKNKKEVE